MTALDKILRDIESVNKSITKNTNINNEIKRDANLRKTIIWLSDWFCRNDIVRTLDIHKLKMFINFLSYNGTKLVLMKLEKLGLLYSRCTTNNTTEFLPSRNEDGIILYKHLPTALTHQGVDSDTILEIMRDMENKGNL